MHIGPDNNPGCFTGQWRWLRYLAPNLVTLASLLFGLLSLRASFEGRYCDAGWFVVYAVLTDKLDGWVARAVKGASEFGVQCDSFADFLNFGVAPAALWYSFLVRAPGLSFAEGGGHGILVFACALWVLAVAFRLARYNVVGDDPSCHRVFFGVPTTLMGGLLVAFFLSCLKYGSVEYQELAQSTFAGEPRLAGLSVGRGIWAAWPIIVLCGALAMASAVKIPKLGLSRSKALSVFIFGNVVLGYGLGFARMMPEYLATVSFLWILGSLVWASLSPAAKSLRPPPIFPRGDRPRPTPQRPEDDAVPEPDEPPDEAAQEGQERPQAASARR